MVMGKMLIPCADVTQKTCDTLKDWAYYHALSEKIIATNRVSNTLDTILLKHRTG